MFVPVEYMLLFTLWKITVILGKRNKTNSDTVYGLDLIDL